MVVSDSILEPKDHPALYQSKAKKFYVLDHSQRVSLYISERESEFDQLRCITCIQADTYMYGMADHLAGQATMTRMYACAHSPTYV